MRKYLNSILLSSSGDILWEGSYNNRLNLFDFINEPGLIRIMKHLCGLSDKNNINQRRTALQMAEDANVVNRKGCYPGFINIMPTGMLIEKCMMAFNREHLRELNTAEITFPIVFDYSRDDIRELTESYENNSRMFRMEERDSNCRLAYAADPGLFSWLRGQVLNGKKLPYAIYSETQAMRRFSSGQIGHFEYMRQYLLPDIHILVKKQQAEEFYLKNVSLGSSGARFWMNEEWAQFIDITEKFYISEPDLCKKIAVAAKKLTLVNILKEQPLYYKMRSGIMLDAGRNSILLYNTQWDEDNIKRFNISSNDNSELVVLHGNVAAGSGILSVIFGRASVGLSPKIFPLELAPIQVAFIPYSEKEIDKSIEYNNYMLDRGIRSAIQYSKKNINENVLETIKKWIPYYSIIGPKETKSGFYMIESNLTKGVKLMPQEFLLKYKGRLDLCRPSAFHTNLENITVNIK